jgi:hypothetical protein
MTMLGLFVEMGVSQTFCLGLPQTMILLIFTFQVAGITGLSHCTSEVFINFLLKCPLYKLNCIIGIRKTIVYIGFGTIQDFRYPWWGAVL